MLPVTVRMQYGEPLSRLYHTPQLSRTDSLRLARHGVAQARWDLSSLFIYQKVERG